MMHRLLFLFITVWPQWLLAADKAGPAADLNEPMSWSNLIQLFLGLAVVIALMLGFAWLMKRMTGFQSTGQGAMRTLGGLSMGSREKVVLVQVGETQLVLGVAPGRVQTLHVMDENIEAPAKEGAGMGSFAMSLQNALQKGRRS